MKKDELPQDMSALGRLTNEVCYVTDNNGKYTTSLSKGWEVKVAALDITWQDIQKQIAEAKEKVLEGKVSPLHFWMTLRMMELSLVASYTGFWQWQIKRHLKPDVFNKLSDKKIQKYAEAFNVSVEDLKTMTVHEDTV
jgi:hypothetical protein